MTITFLLLQNAITINIVNIIIIFYSISRWSPCWSKQIIFYFCLFSVFNKNNVFVPGLQNVLSTIHPIIILCGYSFYINMLFQQSSGNFYKLTNLWISMMFISLFLGGWWALQEFTWGGWWNWDGVETPILLLVSFFTFKLFHSKEQFRSLFFLQKITRLFFNLTIITVMFIRYGNLNSVHSFISLNTIYNQYFTIFYIHIITLFFLVFFKLTSFWSLSFIKTFFFMLLAVFYKNNFLTFIKVRVKYTIHIALAAVSYFLLSFNCFYLEFSGLGSNQGLLNFYSTTSISWVKAQTDFYFYNIYHLKFLIN